MVRRSLPVLLVVAAALALSFLLLGEGSAQGEGDGGAGEPVRVVNFPDPQSVEVEGTPSQARLLALESQLVGPNGDADPTSWRHAGTLSTDGFGWVLLSLGGEVQGMLTEPAAAVAVLVPEREPVLRALKEDGVLLFPLSVSATLTPGREHFAVQTERLPVTFSRYQVYLYNTGARTVEANLYAYLGN